MTRNQILGRLRGVGVVESVGRPTALELLVEKSERRFVVHPRSPRLEKLALFVYIHRLQLAPPHAGKTLRVQLKWKNHDPIDLEASNDFGPRGSRTMVSDVQMTQPRQSTCPTDGSEPSVDFFTAMRFRWQPALTPNLLIRLERLAFMRSSWKTTAGIVINTRGLTMDSTQRELDLINWEHKWKGRLHVQLRVNPCEPAWDLGRRDDDSTSLAPSSSDSD